MGHDLHRAAAPRGRVKVAGAIRNGVSQVRVGLRPFGWHRLRVTGADLPDLEVALGVRETQGGQYAESGGRTELQQFADHPCPPYRGVSYILPWRRDR